MCKTQASMLRLFQQFKAVTLTHRCWQRTGLELSGVWPKRLSMLRNSNKTHTNGVLQTTLFITRRLHSGPRSRLLKMCFVCWSYRIPIADAIKHRGKSKAVRLSSNRDYGWNYKAVTLVSPPRIYVKQCRHAPL